MSHFNRRQLLASTAAFGCLTNLRLSPGWETTDPGREGVGLRDVAHANGFTYGAATNSWRLDDPDFARVLAHQAELVVPESEMKRDMLEPTPGNFKFEPIRKMIEFCDLHGQSFRGHTLVWYRNNPQWLVEALRSERNPSHLLVKYIQAVVGEFRSSVHSWDVVNESIHPNDGRADGLRDSVWMRALGPDFIDMAFHTARNVDRYAKLVLNETGMIYSERRRKSLLLLCEKLRKRKVPVDVIGLQAHLRAFPLSDFKRKFVAQDFQMFLQELEDMGFAIYITELDVDTKTEGPHDKEVQDQGAAEVCERFLDVAMASPAVQAVITWGLSDRYHRYGRDGRGTPMDADLQPKLLWNVLAQQFSCHSKNR